MVKRFSAFLVACALATDAAAQDAPTLPVSIGGGFVSSGAGDTRYLKLDASNDPLTGALNLANGSAAAPSLTWNAGGVNTGFFTASAGLTAWSASGTQELTLSATDIRPAIAGGLSLGTTGVPWLDLHLQAGTAAAPSLRIGDTDSGLIGAAGSMGAVIDAVQELSLTATALSPFLDLGQSLGVAGARFQDVFTSNVRGNNSTINLQSGTTASSAQGVTVTSFSDDSADAVALRINTTAGGGIAGNETSALGAAENGSTVSQLNKLDSTGTGQWVFRTGQIQLSSLTSAAKGVSPVGALPCAAGNSGAIWYKEDTDTALANSQLCLCSRDNGALTYSWKAIGGALTGTCL